MKMGIARQFNGHLFDSSEVYFTESGKMITVDDIPDAVEPMEFLQTFATEFWLTDECGQTAKCGGALVADSFEHAQKIAATRGLDESVVGRLMSRE